MAFRRIGGLKKTMVVDTTIFETVMPKAEKEMPKLENVMPKAETVMPSKKEEPLNKCRRCQHVWLRRVLMPVRCPKCQSVKWQVPRSKTRIERIESLAETTK